MRGTRFLTADVGALGFWIPACTGLTTEVGAGLKPAPTAGLLLVKQTLIHSMAIGVTLPQAL